MLHSFISAEKNLGVRCTFMFLKLNSNERSPLTWLHNPLKSILMYDYLAFAQLLENLRKSSESVRESLENRQ